MARSIIDVLHCDRCGAAQEVRQPDAAKAWGRINGAQTEGPHWVGSRDGQTSRDVCPDCMAGFLGWWRAGLPS